MATIPVKYFHSGMTGAPVLSGTAGALIAILDACLKDGFALKTVDSLVVAGNVATMTISTGHSFEVGTVALVAGASPSTLNGEWRVTAITTNTVQFATTGIADQTATGTITTKLAPLNWTKQFSGTNIAVYKSANVASPGCLFRVADTGTNDARLVGYESMSDINTGLGPFPTSAQLSGGVYWPKSGTANSTARNWVVWGDDRIVYFWCVYGDAVSVTSQGRVYAFGDPENLSSSDSFYPILCGSSQNYSGQQYPYDLSYSRPAGGGSSISTDTGQWQLVSPRSYTGIGGSVQQGYVSDCGLYSTSAGSSSGSGGLLYPNGPDNGLLLVRTGVYVGSNLRSKMPGFYSIPQTVGFGINTRDIVAGQNDFSGRRLMALRVGVAGSGQNSTGGAYGVFVIDIQGPWR